MRRALGLIVSVVATWPCSVASAQESEAAKALRGADAARVEGNADRAVDLYRLALAADAEAGHEIALVASGRWVGVTESALSGLRALTPGAKTLFRERYDARAAAAFEQARASFDALARVYEQYPIATVAPRALEAMADAALARGHRQRAHVALSRLLEHHATEIDEASVREKQAACVPAPAGAPAIGPARWKPRAVAPGDVRHLPVVQGDLVFVATADDLLTFEVRTGEEGRPVPRLGVEYDDQNAKVLFGGAVDGSLVLLPLVQHVLRGENVRGMPIKAKALVRKLAGFDLETWDWSWSHASLLKDTPLASWSFPAPPVAVDGVVFAPALVVAQPAMLSFVAAFDAKTGERRWERRAGSGDVERTTWGEFGVEPLCTPVAVSAGIVYHSTSFGTVVALDATTGRPLWASAYETIEIRAPRGYYVDPREIVWENNAPVVQSGVVVVAPLDSQSYYGFDARTGQRLWSSRYRARPSEGHVRFVLGTGEVDGQGVVVLAGGSEVRCDAVATGKRLWSHSLRGRVVAGRGCVSGGAVLVPVDRDEVFSLDLATGKQTATFPVGTSGNVTLAGEHVVITGNGVLAVHEAGGQ